MTFYHGSEMNFSQTQMNFEKVLQYQEFATWKPVEKFEIQGQVAENQTYQDPSEIATILSP